MNDQTDKHIIAGGIDMGGTKIEGRLFGDRFNTASRHRVATPQTSYEDLLAGLTEEVQRLIDNSGNPDLPVGIAHPGFYDLRAGRLTAANLPVGDNDIVKDVHDRLGRTVEWKNDCQCFALSEAIGGAAADARTMIGLIMGTGLAAGHVINGELRGSGSGIAMEIGHVGLPLRLAHKHNLPTLVCGCGREGCWEAYVAGSGIRKLARARLGVPIDMPEILTSAGEGDANKAELVEIWYDLVAELLESLFLTHDPDVIVLGGGLSLIGGLMDELSVRLQNKSFPGWTPPALRIAEFGDSSGVRGAAILAVQAIGGKVL